MRRVRCYDNQGETADQYTIQTISRPFYCIFSSANPSHPQGVWSAEEMDHAADDQEPEMFGRRISFNKLPERCRKTVEAYLKED